MIDHTPTPGSRSAFRTFCVSGMGTALEFYDFVIYGYAAALVFPKLFFPGMDRLTAVLVAFAAFGAGFFARPLGGVVFGHLGDRYGRQKALVATLLLMGMSTLLIGFLPDYASLGIAAPILLVGLRLVQGFAAGGEWGGAALFGIEVAPRFGVDLHQAERHQRIVGDDAVAAHPALPRRLRPVHPVPGGRKRGHAPVARPDLPGREFFDRGTEGVAEGDAIEHGPDAALEVASAVVGGHLSTVLAYSVMCVLPAALNSSTNCGHWSIVASPVMNLATHER